MKFRAAVCIMLLLLFCLVSSVAVVIILVEAATTSSSSWFISYPHSNYDRGNFTTRFQSFYNPFQDTIYFTNSSKNSIGLWKNISLVSISPQISSNNNNYFQYEHAGGNKAGVAGIHGGRFKDQSRFNTPRGLSPYYGRHRRGVSGLQGMFISDTKNNCLRFVSFADEKFIKHGAGGFVSEASGYCDPWKGEGYHKFGIPEYARYSLPSAMATSTRNGNRVVIQKTCIIWLSIFEEDLPDKVTLVSARFAGGCNEKSPESSSSIASQSHTAHSDVFMNLISASFSPQSDGSFSVLYVVDYDDSGRGNGGIRKISPANRFSSSSSSSNNNNVIISPVATISSIDSTLSSSSSSKFSLPGEKYSAHILSIDILQDYTQPFLMLYTVSRESDQVVTKIGKILNPDSIFSSSSQSSSPSGNNNNNASTTEVPPETTATTSNNNNNNNSSTTIVVKNQLINPPQQVIDSDASKSNKRNWIDASWTIQINPFGVLTSFGYNTYFCSFLLSGSSSSSSSSCASEILSTSNQNSNSLIGYYNWMRVEKPNASTYSSSPSKSQSRVKTASKADFSETKTLDLSKSLTHNGTWTSEHTSTRTTFPLPEPPEMPVLRAAQVMSGSFSLFVSFFLPGNQWLTALVLSRQRAVAATIAAASHNRYRHSVLTWRQKVKSSVDAMSSSSSNSDSSPNAENNNNKSPEQLIYDEDFHDTPTFGDSPLAKRLAKKAGGQKGEYIWSRNLLATLIGNGIFIGGCIFVMTAFTTIRKINKEGCSSASDFPHSFTDIMGRGGFSRYFVTLVIAWLMPPTLSAALVLAARDWNNYYEMRDIGIVVSVLLPLFVFGLVGYFVIFRTKPILEKWVQHEKIIENNDNDKKSNNNKNKSNKKNNQKNKKFQLSQQQESEFEEAELEIISGSNVSNKNIKNKKKVKIVAPGEEEGNENENEKKSSSKNNNNVVVVEEHKMGAVESFMEFLFSNRGEWKLPEDKHLQSTKKAKKRKKKEEMKKKRKKMYKEMHGLDSSSSDDEDEQDEKEDEDEDEEENFENQQQQQENEEEENENDFEQEFQDNFNNNRRRKKSSSSASSSPVQNRFQRAQQEQLLIEKKLQSRSEFYVILPLIEPYMNKFKWMLFCDVFSQVLLCFGEFIAVMENDNYTAMSITTACAIVPVTVLTVFFKPYVLRYNVVQVLISGLIQLSCLIVAILINEGSVPILFTSQGSNGIESSLDVNTENIAVIEEINTKIATTANDCGICLIVGTAIVMLLAFAQFFWIELCPAWGKHNKKLVEDQKRKILKRQQKREELLKKLEDQEKRTRLSGIDSSSSSSKKQIQFSPISPAVSAAMKLKQQQSSFHQPTDKRNKKSGSAASSSNKLDVAADERQQALNNELAREVLLKKLNINKRQRKFEKHNPNQADFYRDSCKEYPSTYVHLGEEEIDVLMPKQERWARARAFWAEREKQKREKETRQRITQEMRGVFEDDNDDEDDEEEEEDDDYYYFLNNNQQQQQRRQQDNEDEDFDDDDYFRNENVENDDDFKKFDANEMDFDAYHSGRYNSSNNNNTHNNGSRSSNNQNNRNRSSNFQQRNYNSPSSTSSSRFRNNNINNSSVNNSRSNFSPSSTPRRNPTQSSSSRYFSPVSTSSPSLDRPLGPAITPKHKQKQKQQRSRRDFDDDEEENEEKFDEDNQLNEEYVRYSLL